MHYFFPYYSAYIMLRASVAKSEPELIDRVSERFIQRYEYFD